MMVHTWAAIAVLAAICTTATAQSLVPPTAPNPPPPPSTFTKLTTFYPTKLNTDAFGEPTFAGDKETAKILTEKFSAGTFANLLVNATLIESVSTSVPPYDALAIYAPNDAAIQAFVKTFSLNPANVSVGTYLNTVLAYHLSQDWTDYEGGYNPANDPGVTATPVNASLQLETDVGYQYSAPTPCGASYLAVKRNITIFAPKKMAVQGAGGVALVKFGEGTSWNLFTSNDGANLWRAYYQLTSVLNPCAVSLADLKNASSLFAPILLDSSLPDDTKSFIDSFLKLAADKLSKVNSSTILVPVPSTIAGAISQLAPKYPNKTALVETLARAHISAGKTVTPLATLAGAVTLNSLLNTTGNFTCGTTFTLTPKAADAVNTDADVYPSISADGGKTQVNAIWYNRVVNVTGGPLGAAALYLIQSPLVPCNFDELYKSVEKGCNPCEGGAGTSGAGLFQLPSALLVLCSMLLAYLL